MKKTVLFAAALFTSLAATAMSIDLESIGMFEAYSPPSTAYLENTRSSWTLVMVPIDDRVPAFTESPQLAWTEMVMQLPLKMTMSNSLDPWTDPDVGWAPGDIWMMNSYCNENYGRSLALMEYPDVGIDWNVWRSDHFYKDVQIKSGFNFSEQWPSAEMSFNDHRYQWCTLNIIFSSPAEHSQYMRARMQYPIAAVPWRTSWYY